MAKTSFDRENHVRNLPDAYDKRWDSNNAKILAIEKREMDAIRGELSDIYASLDLSLASGKTLDLYGEMVGQERGKASDEQYRIMIRARILRNLTNGDYNSIARAISLIFNCDTTDFCIAEKDEPCVVELTGLPFEILNRSGLGVENALKIINEIIPAGVRLETLSFDGTFEFSDAEEEQDAAAGFGDIEQTLGGYFGLLASGDTSNLPV